MRSREREIHYMHHEQRAPKSAELKNNLWRAGKVKLSIYGALKTVLPGIDWLTTIKYYQKSEKKAFL